MFILQVFKTKYPESLVFSFTRAVLDLQIFEKVSILWHFGFVLKQNMFNLIQTVFDKMYICMAYYFFQFNYKNSADF